MTIYYYNSSSILVEDLTKSSAEYKLYLHSIFSILQLDEMSYFEVQDWHTYAT